VELQQDHMALKVGNIYFLTLRGKHLLTHALKMVSQVQSRNYGVIHWDVK
jgi:hypothetical protein